jgi:multicomponent Na+:H+ antiporter subunit E
MRPETGWRILRFIITAIAMFTVWLMFTARFDLFSVTAGIIGALFIAALTYNVFIARHETTLRSFLFRPLYLPVYLLILMVYLYGSSIRMLGAVFSGNVNPRIVHFRTRLRSDLARMVLANSITFTPGTITLDLNDDHLTVHWFFCNTRHAKAAGEAVKGRMERHIRRIWL